MKNAEQRVRSLVEEQLNPERVNGSRVREPVVAWKNHHRLTAECFK
jgi:hypothetical protein